MNKTYLKTTRLRNGDVVATSKYWKMSNLGNSMPYDLEFVSPSGEVYGYNDLYYGQFGYEPFEKGGSTNSGAFIAYYFDWVDSLGADWNGYYKYDGSKFTWHHALKK